MIVLDTETTGLDPDKNSLLSIGALEFESPENQFYGECRIWDGAEIETIALEINGFSKISSNFIFRYVGIIEEREEHNALEDAKLTAEAISRLLHGKQLLEEYKKFPIPWK
jgi:DNA polymerase III epsilon subunit-like protein